MICSFNWFVIAREICDPENVYNYFPQLFNENGGGNEKQNNMHNLSN